jgi:hypothetical protein
MLLKKLLQYLASIAGGLLIAFESSIVFFVPCMIITGMDVYSAYRLGKRVSEKHPDKSDGKFKSGYKYRIIYTMIIVFLGIITAHYADVHVLKDTDTAVRSFIGVFFVYQIWSILENWSSENDNKFALVLQRIMVNKAERHFNIEISDILLNEKKKKENDGGTINPDSAVLDAGESE